MGRLGVYARASTANPTGRRPWNSRLSFYIPNSFAVPTTGQGRYLLNPGVTGKPAANGGLSFYGPAQFAVPTTSMSRPLRRRLGAIANGGGGFQSPIIARSGGGLKSSNWLPVTSSGFTPIASSRSGSPVYTSAPGLAASATGQGYYQIGTNANGQPIYSTNPSAAQLYQAQQQGLLQQAAAAQAAAAAASSSAVAPSTSTTTTTTSSVSDFLSEDSLGFGLNNGWYLAIGGAAVLLLMNKRGR